MTEFETKRMQETAHHLALGAIEAREVCSTEDVWAAAIERMIASAQREAYAFGRKA